MEHSRRLTDQKNHRSKNPFNFYTHNIYIQIDMYTKKMFMNVQNGGIYARGYCHKLVVPAGVWYKELW